MAGASSAASGAAERFLGSLRRLAAQTARCHHLLAPRALDMQAGKSGEASVMHLMQARKLSSGSSLRRRLMSLTSGALGPAGVLPRKGETVEILEEGHGMEQGFNVVRRPGGDIGIFPKQYLQLQAQNSEKS
eukprot:TRINITY_DN15239_c0_g1_i1.p1 TRINITY_DN15239_c0_g1~~TRINITY_DN15239_c0_g1_i1.p1  ORF type:complete len:139 (-),score=34.26 TRINITY_DN15239_c0_g1_i1:95-490(-)